MPGEARVVKGGASGLGCAGEEGLQPIRAPSRMIGEYFHARRNVKSF